MTSAVSCADLLPFAVSPGLSLYVSVNVSLSPFAGPPECLLARTSADSAMVVCPLVVRSVCQYRPFVSRPPISEITRRTRRRLASLRLAASIAVQVLSSSLSPPHVRTFSLRFICSLVYHFPAAAFGFLSQSCHCSPFITLKASARVAC